MLQTTFDGLIQFDSSNCLQDYNDIGPEIIKSLKYLFIFYDFIVVARLPGFGLPVKLNN